MKKIDNFSASLDVLAHADFQQAHENVIYRTGIVGQFNQTFELAWKALQAVLRAHNVIGAESGSPLGILKLGYKTGFLSDSEVWILMHKKRNIAVHEYSEEDIDTLIILIRDTFIPAFSTLLDTLTAKAAEAESDSWEDGDGGNNAQKGG